MDTRHLSGPLCDYIGRMELMASDLNRDNRHELFKRELGMIIGVILEGISPSEMVIARHYLNGRIKETQSENVGCACGEAGEAD